MSLVQNRVGWLRRAYSCRLKLIGLILSISALFCLTSSPVRSTPVEGESKGVDQISSLADLDLEQLMDLDITSVSKHVEKLSDSAAAVSVITQEDIRRSGLTSIPEILRMTTGMEVAHIDSSKWAITARGFNDRFANKLLVLVDGRSVYDPLFSGVWWDVQGTSLEDIERIEVIRGPGASLWGANAVNGVINIITKKATESSTTSLTTAFEYSNGSIGTMRFAAPLNKGAVRVFSNFNNNTGFKDALGVDAPDTWQERRTGMRMDIDTSSRDSLSVQAAVYTGTQDQILEHWSYFAPYHVPLTFTGGFSGRNCLACLSRKLDDGGSQQFQMYYDHTERSDGILRQSRDTIDFDVQQNCRLNSTHDLTYGLGYRTSKDDLWSNEIVQFDQNSESNSLANAFVQDEVSILPHKLRLTLGTKVEHNSFNGYEIQPDARLLWEPTKRQTIWTAVSRAARTPSRFERTFRYYDINYANADGYPVMEVVTGNPDLDAEILNAYQIGYRVQPSKRFSMDVTGYYNKYDRFISYEKGEAYLVDSPVPHVIQPLIVHNNMNARTYGLEVSANYRPTDNWRLSAGYTNVNVALTPEGDGTDITYSNYSGSVPRNQLNIRSLMDLSHDIELDAMLFYVDQLKSYQVPSYVRLDLRLGWMPHRDVELSIGVHNAFDAHHLEFGGGALSVGATEVPREYYAKISRKF